MKNRSDGFTVLDQILSEIEEEDLDMKVRELCDQIQDEELQKHPPNYPDQLPEGPNIFLSLEIPPTNKNQINFLTLEREIPGEFIVCLYGKNVSELDDNTKPTKKIKSWNVNESKAKKVLLLYARILKMYRS